MASTVDKEVEQRFNLVAADLKALIEKRRGTWRAFSIMEWEDVASILLTRIYQQFHLYDIARPLDRWANTVISHTISNLLRDKLYKTARPCVAANSYGAPCSFNIGGDKCSWTPSGKQCGECKFFARWEKKKKNKFAISTPLSMEHHVNEAHSMPDDSIDIDGAKKLLDVNIARRLSKEEGKIYILLYINNLTMEEAAQKMGFKKTGESDMKAYLRVRTASIKIKEVAMQILSESGVLK